MLSALGAFQSIYVTIEGSAAYNDRTEGTTRYSEREPRHGSAGWRARKTRGIALSSLLPSSCYVVYGGEESVDERESDYTLGKAATGSPVRIES